MEQERSFRDRGEAGRRPAAALSDRAGRDDILVLGLPRGGVLVASEVARALAAPLDVFLVRRLGVPGHGELAMGAIASGGVRILNEEVIRMFGLTEQSIAEVAAQEQRELERRERVYRKDRPTLEVGGRTVILVDDGLATGSTMNAAVLAVRAQHPRELIVAVPVGTRESCEALRGQVDEVVCLSTPESFGAVSDWYDDFTQTTDEEVLELLAGATAP
jgi:putative phosphoribosyl transferase